ncbi:MAG TPA: hypothetical protein VJY39_23360 [Acidisphaera sp.]|nr:hypothetical protein [Acidisphaera sp.]
MDDQNGNVYRLMLAQDAGGSRAGRRTVPPVMRTPRNRHRRVDIPIGGQADQADFLTGQLRVLAVTAQTGRRRDPELALALRRLALFSEVIAVCLRKLEHACDSSSAPDAGDPPPHTSPGLSPEWVARLFHFAPRRPGATDDSRRGSPAQPGAAGQPGGGA